jgi:hypothetical protein
MSRITLRIGDTNAVWVKDVTIVTDIKTSTTRAILESDFTEAWFTLKRSKSDADSERVYWLRFSADELTFTEAASSYGARFDGELPAEVLLLFSEADTLFYDWQVLVDSKPKTIDDGIAVLVGHSTHATS